MSKQCIDTGDAVRKVQQYLEDKPLLQSHVHDAIQHLIDRTKVPDFTAMKILRLTNLLGDIINEATNNPARLTSFNSPLLQLAAIELWNHNNPDKLVDDQTVQIYQQLALASYNG